MQEELGEAAERLKIKIEKLIHLQYALQADNKILKEENSQLKAKLEEGSGFQLLSKTIGRDVEKKTEAKRKINDLIREIDRCITLLTNESSNG